MPLDNTNSHNETDDIYQSPSIDYHAIRQWVQHVESFQAHLTPPAEDYYVSSAPGLIQQLASEMRHWAPVWQTPPEEDFRENASLSGVAQPAYWRDIRSPTSQPCCPPTPLMLNIPLPLVIEEFEEVSATTASPALPIRDGPTGHPPITTSDHRSGGSAHHERVAVQRPMDIPEMTGRPEGAAGQYVFIANELGFEGSIRRPVVEPVLSDMPAYDGHRWGARDEHTSIIRWLSVHFPQSTKPATVPPVKKMRLAWPFGGTLLVRPTIGSRFVSVVDIQKAVIVLMRAERPYIQDENTRFTQRTIARGRDGTAISVEVWAWKGLTRARDELDLWEIHL
jgi:hypothetical protein